jgi:hypothetical protein
MLVLAMERSTDGRQAARGRIGRLSAEAAGLGSARSKVSGDHGGGATPVPIPNTAVKPASADGTWGASPWESRTSPDFFERRAGKRGAGICSAVELGIHSPSTAERVATSNRNLARLGCFGPWGQWFDVGQRSTNGVT